MKLIFKQRVFSWFDSYDIYDEYGNTVFTVEGKMSWGKKLHINDASGTHIATLQQKIFSFMPTFDIFLGERHVGSIKKEFTFFTPSFNIDFNGWHVEGNFLEWDYNIKNESGDIVATLEKKIMNWTDTYVLEIAEAYDAVTVLMVALAIDAEKDIRRD